MSFHAAQGLVTVSPRHFLTTLAGGFGGGVLCAASLCLLWLTPAVAGVSVMPLSEKGGISTVADSSLPPSWQHGRLLPEEEWKRYSNRPHAFDHAMTLAENHPDGATRAVRDPAYLPVLPMTESKAVTKSKSKKSAATPAITRPAVPVVASPYGTSLSRPGAPAKGNPQGISVSSPTVATPNVPSPKVPTVASPKSPTVASPYSAAAEPTGPVSNPANPVTPASPRSAAVASPSSPDNPSLAAQPEAQDGLMTSGRGIVADMANGVAAGIVAAKAAESGISAGLSTSDGSVSANTAKNGRDILRGPADSLVVPPTGISLSPNNGSGALTAPANPQ